MSNVQKDPIETMFTEEDPFTQEEPVVEVKDASLQEFRDYVGDRPYMIIDKQDISHFIKLLEYHSTLGFEEGTIHIRLDPFDLENGNIQLVYNNGLAAARTSIPVEHQGTFEVSVIVIQTLLRVAKNGTNKLLLFIDNGKMYSYLFGGRVFIETVTLVSDIHSKYSGPDPMIDSIDTDVLKEVNIDAAFITELEVARNFIKLGTTSDERTVYLEGNNLYLCIARLLQIRLKGAGVSMSLQYMDLTTLILFFMDLEEGETFTIRTYKKIHKITYKDRVLYLDNKDIKLPVESRYTETVVDGHLTIEDDQLDKVVSFLSTMQNNTGVLQFVPKKYGFDIVCQQKTLDNHSRFPIKCDITGSNPITEFRVQLDLLKILLNQFKGTLQLELDINRLFISGECGKSMLYVNVS